MTVLLAFINQGLEAQGIFIPIIHSYLDDFLCFPIVFSVGLAGYRVVLKSETYLLRPIQIWPVVVLYIVVFEIYLPQISSVYTADWRDVVAYVCGTLVFLKWLNRVG